MKKYLFLLLAGVVGLANWANADVKISAGLTSTCFLSQTAPGVPDNGKILCFGDNDFGQLGNGTVTPSNVPTPITSALTWTGSLAVGDTHACAVASNNDLYCWGRNNRGQLGRGNFVDSSVPVFVTSNVVNVVAGGDFTCAQKVVSGQSSLSCWGANDFGQLGIGSLVDKNTPQNVSTFTNSYALTALAAGADHACVNKSTTSTASSAYCWGKNSDGQLGIGSTVNKSTPQAVNVGGSVTWAGAGDSHTCMAVTVVGGTRTSPIYTRGIKCWGNNGFGQLGTGNFFASTTPVQVSGTSGTSPVQTYPYWTATTLGVFGSCGMRVSLTGAANCTINDPPCLVYSFRCWGDNGNGQLGDGTTVDSTTPVQTFLSSPTIQISVPQFDMGATHACGTFTETVAAAPPLHWTSTFKVLCWGDGSVGQVGNGSFNPVNSTPQVIYSRTYSF